MYRLVVFLALTAHAVAFPASRVPGTYGKSRELPSIAVACPTLETSVVPEGALGSGDVVLNGARCEGSVEFNFEPDVRVEDVAPFLSGELLGMDVSNDGLVGAAGFPEGTSFASLLPSSSGDMALECGGTKYSFVSAVFMAAPDGSSGGVIPLKGGVSYVALTTSTGFCFLEKADSASAAAAAASADSTAAPTPSSTSPTESPAATPKDGFGCFPASATVELECGTTRRMADLRVGDVIKVAAGRYSPVFTFSHRSPSADADFVSVRTDGLDAPLRLTEGHYLPINGALRPAAGLRPGDRVDLGTGHTATVTAVSTTRERGLYNPHTLDGHVVVDGVLTSTYTTAVVPSVAHALLSPLRGLWGSGLKFDALFGALDDGARCAVGAVSAALGA